MEDVCDRCKLTKLLEGMREITAKMDALGMPPVRVPDLPKLSEPPKSAEEGPEDPTWVFMIKCFLIPAGLFAAMFAMWWVLQVDDILPKDKMALAGLAVVGMTAIWGATGLFVWSVCVLLTKLAGAKPVPFVVVVYFVLTGLGLGVVCALGALRPR
jgi:hypothetical protein